MRFYIVDVFAERKYAGNQLAVYILDQALSQEQMLQIAREIHFSEITFILSDKQSNGGYDVRIFTPDVEVPFAGHPTLGAAYVIQQFLERGQTDKVTLNLEVGQIMVYFHGDELIMDQKQPAFQPIIHDLALIAKMLQIYISDIDERYPIQVVSTGLPSVIVPLISLNALKRCSVHQQSFQQFLDRVAKVNVLVFATELESENDDLRVRVFVDDQGFLEDSATGSANGNLAAYLLEHNFFGSTTIEYQARQGHEMGRPALLKINAKKTHDHFQIRVGGKVFLVANGDWLSNQ